MPVPADKMLAQVQIELQPVIASTHQVRAEAEVRVPNADEELIPWPALEVDPPRQKWYQWFAPGDTPEERCLLLKLDGMILGFVFLAYFSKVLDSSAVSTAYVSGMKEDLNMYGNELIYLNTIYMAGNVVPQIPLTVLATRISTRFFIPGADLIWSILTLIQYKATSVNQLYALRFFIGAAGSLFFPAVQWYMGCWYKRSELSRRGALFFIASQIGSMSAGYIQSAAYAHLNGKYGIEGWRWLYIICFACTTPIAIIGFLILPSHPDTCKSFILTRQDIEVARYRMSSENRQPTKELSIPIMHKIFTGWHFWVLVSLAFFFSQADGIASNSGLPLWLKQEGYSVYWINILTAFVPAVTILSTIFCGVISDAYDKKVSLIAGTSLLNIAAGIILAIWDVSGPLKLLAFLLSGTADGVAAVIYAWANEICTRNAEERVIVISFMNTIGNVFNTLVPLGVWRTTDAPRYLIGYIWNIFLDVGMLIMVFVLRHYWNRDRRGGTI